MLENVAKGMIYSLNSFTVVDKKSGKEKGLIDICYIYQNPNETATSLGWQSGHSFVEFSDKVWTGLKAQLLKNVDLKFRLVPDFKDSTRYTSKLVSINDIVIKQ